MLKNEWGDETKTFVYCKFTPDWTWDEFHSNRPQYEAMLGSVNHRVDFVGDFSDAPMLPPNVFDHTKNVYQNRLENEGYTIIVGAGKYVQLMYDLLAQTLPLVRQFVIFVPDMKTAYEIVQAKRDSTEVNL